VLTVNDVDRFKMMQEQQTLTLRDLDDLTKRNRDLYERFTAVDIECSRVTEDLITANGQLDQLRNACANLRAEKKIWEVSISLL
jgi:nucleoprotein TPR